MLTVFATISLFIFGFNGPWWAYIAAGIISFAPLIGVYRET